MGIGWLKTATFCPLLETQTSHQNRGTETKPLMLFPKKATKMIKGLENEIYGEWPQEQRLFCLDKRKGRGVT